MTQRDDQFTLQQLRDHAVEAAQLVSQHCREDLDKDRVLCLAMIQLMQIVGEAACRLSEDFHLRHTEVPWSRMIALRNRLIHGYDTIDRDILWQILSVDLPELINQCDNILREK